MMDEIIVISLKKGEKVTLHEFDNNAKGQKAATQLCKEAHKEHMRHPFFQLMQLANGKPELQDFIRHNVKAEPPSLSVEIQTINKEDAFLL